MTLPYQVLWCTGGARFDSAALSPAHEAVLDAAGIPQGARVPVDYPFPDATRPWRHTALGHASAVNAARWLWGERALREAARKNFIRRVAQARYTIVLAASQGIELLDRMRLPREVQRRLVVIAVGPVAGRMLRGVTPLPDAEVITVCGRRDWPCRVLARKPDLLVPGGHLASVRSQELSELVARVAGILERAAGEAERGAQSAQDTADATMLPPRVDIVTPPFAGHAHPLFGVAHALKARGCRVRVISTDDFAEKARVDGLDAVGVLSHRSAEVEALSGTAEPDDRRPDRLLRTLRKTIGILDEMAGEVREIWWHDPADVVLADSVLPFVGHLAAERGALWATGCASPLVIETPVVGAGSAPPIYLGGLLPGKGLRVRARDLLGKGAMRAVKIAGSLLTWRVARRYGIRSAYRADGSETVYSPQRILAFGDLDFEFAKRWPRAVRFTGPVRYAPAAVRKKAAAEREKHADFFAAAKSPLALLTLGTHRQLQKQQLPALVTKILAANPGLRLVISLGGSDAAGLKERIEVVDPERVRVLTLVDYARLNDFDLVIHHAGMGITWSALAAGVPQAVLPIDHDQFDVAARLVARNLAVRAKNAADLPRAVREALEGADANIAERERWCGRLAVDAGADRAATQMLADWERWRLHRMLRECVHDLTGALSTGADAPHKLKNEER